jgi:hypothetical protein
LVMSCIPYLGPVGQHWDDKCIIDLSPIEEIEASLCVAQDVNPVYSQVCAVGHDTYVIVSREVSVQIDAEVPEGVSRGDVAGALYQVNVSKAQGCVPHEVAVSRPLLEGH